MRETWEVDFCKTQGCDGKVRARELCQKHYDRLRRHQTLQKPKCQLCQKALIYGRDDKKIGSKYLCFNCRRNGKKFDSWLEQIVKRLDD